MSSSLDANVIERYHKYFILPVTKVKHLPSTSIVTYTCETLTQWSKQVYSFLPPARSALVKVNSDCPYLPRFMLTEPCLHSSRPAGWPMCSVWHVHTTFVLFTLGTWLGQSAVGCNGGSGQRKTKVTVTGRRKTKMTVAGRQKSTRQFLEDKRSLR